MINKYLDQAKSLLTNEWQSLSELKKHYGFIVWETLVWSNEAEMRIEYLGNFKGCRHYYRLAI